MQTDELRALLAADESHWWYRGRRRVLAAALDRLPLPARCASLDAGCGSGRTMEDLAERGPVSGFDLSSMVVELARERGFSDVQVARVEDIPHPDDSFDVVTCLDVIEHTVDDVASLRELRRVSRPGAFLVVTVPAYQALWSAHDQANQHYRRYRLPRLRRAARAAGWEPLRFSYFNSILFAPAAVVRLSERTRPSRPSRSPLQMTPPVLNGLLELPLRIEAAVIRRGIRLPVGLSLMGVFRNPADVAALTPQPVVSDWTALAASSP